MNLQLGVHNPADPIDGYPKQWDYLNIDRSQPGTSHNHWVGGRGTSKTTTGVLLALRASLEWMPGLPGMVTEPTGPDIWNKWMAEWRFVVPSELYKLNSTYKTLTMKSGSIIYMVSREVKDKYAEPGKGLNVAWAIHDEAAYRFDPRKFEDMDTAVRLKTPYRFSETLSTPQLGGGYFDWCHQDGHDCYHSSSLENPYLDDESKEQLKNNYSAKAYEREVLGLWVSLEGQIWEEWSKDPWPQGNVHLHEHDRSIPYYLAVDLGSRNASFLVIQPVDPVDDNGIQRWEHDPLWVVTAEYTPTQTEGGSTSRVCRQIDADYGAPRQVIVGADVNTRDTASGHTSAFFIRQVWGSDVQIVHPGGMQSAKDIQYDRLSYMIHNTKGQRRLAISAGIQSHRSAKKGDWRGVAEVMERDTWPEKSEQKVGQFLPKDGLMEHTRDSLLYFAACLGVPPRTAKAQSWAK